MVKIDVITYCSGYDYHIYDRFVGSLNDTGFTGKIYLIVNEVDKPIIKMLKKKYSNIYPFNDKIEKTTHINCHRFFCINLLLKNIQFESDYLFICDSRDVLFQRNIEEYNYDNNVDIYGFLEGITIEKEQVFNARWIKQIEMLLNENIYDLISDKNVICCGTTLGKVDAIKHYVKKMCGYIKDYRIRTNLDQGLHNYMLYLNKLDCNIKLLSNEENLVNTTGNDIRKINDDKFIVNTHNEVSWIVHQYDRFPLELKKEISVKYDFTN